MEYNLWKPFPCPAYYTPLTYIILYSNYILQFKKRPKSPSLPKISNILRNKPTGHNLTEEIEALSCTTPGGIALTISWLYLLGLHMAEVSGSTLGKMLVLEENFQKPGPSQTFSLCVVHFNTKQLKTWRTVIPLSKVTKRQSGWLRNEDNFLWGSFHSLSPDFPSN